MSGAQDVTAIALELIGSLPGFVGYRFNPQSLIKVTNYLRILRKNRALSILRDYDAMSVKERTVNPENAWLAARTLFVPVQEGEALPELRLGRPDLEQPRSELAPLFPLHIYEGMPFLLLSGYLAGGEALPPIEYLEWARRAAEVRPEPLAPTDDPLQSVDRFLESETWKSLNPPEGHKWMLRLQALRAISNVLPVTEQDASALTVAPIADRNWKHYRQKVAGLAIRWNPASDDYELRNNS